MDWINSHGMVLLIGGYILALLISAAPPLPTGSGFFKTWAYNAMQIVGASADKIVSSNPKFQALSQLQTAQRADGSTVQTETKVITESPKA
jgi:hypothetical protein